MTGKAVARAVALAAVALAAVALLFLALFALQAGCAHASVHIARVYTEGGLTYRKGGCT